MTDRAVKFWTGPIGTEANARKITRYTATGFLIFGLLVLLIGAVQQFDVPMVLTGLLFAVPAAILFRSGSLLAARVLLGLAVFCVGVSLLLAAAGLISASMHGSYYDRYLGITGAVLTVFWSLPLAVMLRAGKAAKFLRDATRTGAG